MLIIPFSDDSPRYRMQYTTFGLIAANVLIHGLISSRRPNSQFDIWMQFASLGEHYNPLRAVSAAFLHADWWHLIGNMWFLFLFGSAVEGKLGIRWMLGLYLACILLSDLAQHFLSPTKFVLALGASGAVGGLAGAFWFLFSNARVQFLYWIGFWIGTTLVSVNWAMLYLFGWDVVMFLSAAESGVAHSAHLGGLICGLVCGLVLRYSGYITLDGEDMLTKFVLWRGRRKRKARFYQEAANRQDRIMSTEPAASSQDPLSQRLEMKPKPNESTLDEPTIIPFD